jgi:hypothetical protein
MAKSALPPAATHDVTAGADMPLDGKVAIVTGASRGIGRAISRGRAAHGARVVAASRTEVDTSCGSPHQKYASGTIFDTAWVTNSVNRMSGCGMSRMTSRSLRSV